MSALSQHQVSHSPEDDNGRKDQAQTDLTRDDIHIIEAPAVTSFTLKILAISLILGLAIALSLFFIRLPVLTALALLAGTFVTSRFVYLRRARAQLSSQAWNAAKHQQAPAPVITNLPAVYFTYVLGSGGHTSELCNMIRYQFRGHANLHRRYIISSGDNYSLSEVLKLENKIKKAYPRGLGGTWDVVRVRRARDIYQPLWTAWYTSILSTISILNTIMLPPQDRSGPAEVKNFRYPHVIVTNGPGTGFIVCLVAYILKFCFLVPDNRAKIMYIETWAHPKTLSLTGKLFYATDIADMFLAQHDTLAEKIGRPCVGEISKQGNLLGIKEQPLKDAEKGPA